MRVKCGVYKSSTTYESEQDLVWDASMVGGYVHRADTVHRFYAWPVRGGNEYATGDW